MVLAVICLMAASVQAANVTGDPAADGWHYHGNALDNGLYAAGSANYNYEMYSASFAVQSGSNLEISDGGYSWQAGDTILGAGGKFTDITASEAGWDNFTGNTVNSLLAEDAGPRLQVKMGTADATWSTSDTAPDDGGGYTSTSGGGGDGAVLFRTSSWFEAGDSASPSSGEGYTWDDNSGQVLVLDKDSHIWRVDDGEYVSPDREAARMIWNWDSQNGVVDGWELLLNVSLLDRLDDSGNDWDTPAPGDPFVWSVQDRDDDVTDAVDASVPEPATMGLLALGGLALIRRRRRTA
ncbi:MAG: PEP-CTERM sorting domain-containing protein [Phycisphaerae bacterium]